MTCISLGNDIVDLTDPDTIDLTKHLKFIHRVYSSSELEIADSYPPDSRNTFLWKLWAAKEAAYKTIKRIRSEAIFSPKQFVCNVNPDRVCYQDLDININYLENNQYIHASGLPASDSSVLQNVQLWIDVQTEIEKLIYQEPMRIEASYSRESTLCRSYASIKVKQYLNSQGQEIKIEIKKDANKIKSVPEIWVNGEKTSHLVSTSHHGRYCAVLFCPV